MERSRKVLEVMPGCKIIETQDGRIMAGCPSDTLKVLLKKGWEVPDIIILPNHFYLYGVVQANLEFILYYFLFAKNYLAQGKKLTVIGAQREIERAREILRISLLGPTEEQMASWGVPRPIIDRTLGLARCLGVKKPGAEELASINDLIRFLPYENNARTVGDTVIERIDANVFKFMEGGEETLVDINIAETQKPPIPIRPPKTHIPRPILGATALGKCTTGFDPTGYTSGIIVWANGMGILIDGVSWATEHLRAMGISPGEIRAHIITHIHDDHSNILDLIVGEKKFPLISDKLGYECLAEKISLILDIPREEVKKMIGLIEVKPGQPLRWYGATIEIWPTAHSIPTFGVRIAVAGKSIMYSGDTVYGKRLAKLFEVGAVGLDFCQTVQIAPYQSDSLVFHDAGEGAVHPGLNEIIALARKTESCVIPTHLETIPEHPESEFEPIIPGQTWEIIPQRTWQAGDLLRVLRTPILSEVGEDWLAAVVSLGALKEYSKGQTITAKGRTDKCVCVIISGNARVLDDAEEEIARLWSGDIFGEMAIMYGNPRNATVVAGSPVKVLELRGDIFLEMAKSTGLYDSLEAIHRTRPAFLRFPTIKNLPARVQNRIYSSARMMRAKAGETIIRQGDIGDSLYGIFKGKADVVLRGKTLATLYRGHLFGEIALLENGIRTADVVARTDVELFRISKDDFYVIVSNAPSFRYSLEMLIKNRNK